MLRLLPLTAVFGGATSHKVRDDFQSWVPKNLEDRLQPDATNPHNDVEWVHATSTPRCEYGLFVDDVSLESVDHLAVNCQS
ncbi:hypothetical protein J3459_014764 [Metarhizium acridum]|uniref:uncharacterized protein n=1 Tax=Metarhizium acridum TaxID=92637 RepID=UPI001C6A9CCE|nr:hypothetical protein J3458_014363 [Metarhizium acridum]KAG8414423.1 hypothetical protein J3459_014764 [Metarhizium acridum]